MSQDLSDEFLEAIRNESNATEVDRVASRDTHSDNFSGTQYKIYGSFVSIRPIIDIVADKDGIAIEHVYHCTDAEESHVGVFVADLPEQPHPAFVLSRKV